MPPTARTRPCRSPPSPATKSAPAAGLPAAARRAHRAQRGQPGRQRRRGHRRCRCRTHRPQRRTAAPGSRAPAPCLVAAASPRRGHCPGARGSAPPLSEPVPATGHVRPLAPISTLPRELRARETAVRPAVAHLPAAPLRRAAGHRGSARHPGAGPCGGGAARARHGTVRCAACPPDPGPCSFSVRVPDRRASRSARCRRSAVVPRAGSGPSRRAPATGRGLPRSGRRRARSAAARSCPPRRAGAG